MHSVSVRASLAARPTSSNATVGGIIAMSVVLPNYGVAQWLATFVA